MRRWRVFSPSFPSHTVNHAFIARQGIAQQCPERDDRRVLSGIIFINRNGLRWRDAPVAYGPHKTLYNRSKRWSDKGIFAQIMFGRLKDWRRVATRYDRCPKAFLSAIVLAALLIYWLWS